jgi:hypothetical protein
MTSLADTIDRYKAISVILRFGVDIAAVSDPLGEKLNGATWELVRASRDHDEFPLDDLLGAARLLRWRLLAQPQPLRLNPDVVHAIDLVRDEARRIDGGVGEILEKLTRDLVGCINLLSAYDPASGRRISEILDASEKKRSTVVIAVNERAASGLAKWLSVDGIAVRTSTQLERDQQRWDYAIAVGPPRLFGSRLLTAPRTFSETFVFPQWYGDRSLPRSVISDHAEGAILIMSRRIGIEAPETVLEPSDIVEDDLLPHIVWTDPISSRRDPTSDESIAHLVLLSGNLAIYLDDGERIRSFAPDQPDDERVGFTDVKAVRPGTYLLLREGESEHGALYSEAIEMMGARGVEADASQRRWKSVLEERFNRLGVSTVLHQLEERGVLTLERVRAWTHSTLVRPQNESDFEALLSYLDVPLHPTVDLANDLRKKRMQASARLRRELEAAIASSELSELERVGYVRLNLERRGTRGIIAARVLSVSPHGEIVPRSDVRVIFEDRRAKWLE